jgi:arylsulfatase A-like enzyme
MNVLLVVLDSVRAANCSLYGYQRPTTPALESLADNATVYRSARAPSNWTLPSHVSLFTGLEAATHGVTIHDQLEPGHTVWDDLGDAGYDTGLFTENGFVADHSVGLSEPFDTVVSVPDDPPDRYSSGDHTDRPDGFYYADRLCEWTDGRSEWAACLNLMDAHRPYDPAPEYDRWGDAEAHDLQSALPIRWEFDIHEGTHPIRRLDDLVSLYDGGISQADAVVASLVERLRRRGVFEETLLVVCGDHGEGFGEPGRLPDQPPAVAHIVPMTESLLHVPLLAKFPGQRTGRTVDDPAALTAFRDVVAAARRGERATFTRSQVLASKQPVTGDLRERYEAAVDDATPFLQRSRAVYEPAETGVRKTYSWGDAVGEAHVPNAGAVGEVTTADRERIDSAFASVEDADVRRPDRESVDDGTRDHLEALGYF